jgi:phage terminase large subunit
MEISTSIVFEHNWDAMYSDKRFIINQGSSRSSKTHSLCQLIIIFALTTDKQIISIVRKSFPTLRATVMRDFFTIMKEMKLYDRQSHNKTENIYTFPNGSMVEFFSCDDEQKIRGRARTVCWANEANELRFDDYNQLNIRTTGKFIVDYNPSDASSWIYELPAAESIIIKSTFRDNPFLEKSLVKQIENLQYTDQALWSIYGLGERCMSRRNIYSNWNFVSEKPERFVDYVMGIDFGYNHPTALVKVYYFEDELYIEKIIYQSYLTTTELIAEMEKHNIDKNIDMMADYARPEIIEEIRREGYSIKNAMKSVKKGIDDVKTYRIYVNENDDDIKKEYENYMWKKNGDNITDEPVKLFDDGLDAMRYAVAQIKQSTATSGPILYF